MDWNQRAPRRSDGKLICAERARSVGFMCTGYGLPALGRSLVRPYSEISRLFLEFNDAGAVIDPHGTELAQEILAEQPVKIHVEHLL